MPAEAPLRGRGTRTSPRPRFEPLEIERLPESEIDPDATPRAPAPRTRFLRDGARSAIARNDSPDIGFDTSLNPYRGCEHGCIYCYARPTHEYLGLSAGLDFETKILVKEDAPDLLRRELSSRHWRPQGVALSGVTDAYQPVERVLHLTRRCLEVLAEFRNPVSVTTKSDAVVRDLDLLGELARHRAVSVTISITTLDSDLARRLEPRAAQPGARLRTVERLAAAGVPVGVNIAPVIPALTDHEIAPIAAAAARAGARWASWQMVRLPLGVGDLFRIWLEDHFPLRARKVLHRIAQVRAGGLDQPGFGLRLRGTGFHARQIESWYRLAIRRTNLDPHPPALSTASFRRPSGPQLELF
jgi:DNA repair photolyase